MNELTTLPGPVWGCELIGSPLILAGVYNAVAPVLSDGDVCALQVDVNGKLITSGGGGGGSTAFSAITSGTNTTAAMVVGSGASLGVSGTGLITGPFTSATVNPATAGMLRLAKSDAINFRNEANGADINGLKKVTNADSNDVVQVGDAGGALISGALYGPASSTFLIVGGTVASPNQNMSLYTGNGGASITLGTGAHFVVTGDIGALAMNAVGAKIVQYNGVNTVSGGVPAEYATVDRTGEVAAITTTPLYTPTATGLFRISAYAKVTTAATTASLGGSTGLTLGYTDGDDSVAQTLIMDMASETGSSVIVNPNSTTASKLVGSSVIFAKTGVAITYAFGYSSSVGTMAYSLHLKIEAF